MSEILARIRVRETHGIRRFLYPLTAMVDLPEDIDVSSLGWSGTKGDAVPLQFTPHKGQTHRLDFALSLAPMEERTLEIVAGGFQFAVPDALQVAAAPNGGLHSRQEKVSFDIMPDGNISQIIYDGISHLSEPSHSIHILYQAHETLQGIETSIRGGPLAAWLSAKGTYRTGFEAETITEVSACKSWVKQNHLVQTPDRNDLFQFGIGLIPTATTLLCDFGVGGGIYGKLQPGPNGSLSLRFQIAKDGTADWRLATTDEMGRMPQVNYRGRIEQGLESQLWFHILDTDKSLAVAITKVPDSCREITIHLSIDRSVSITYELDGDAAPAEFGVCYHFLNDVPAIAAATNPQSILLPPVVDVLPV